MNRNIEIICQVCGAKALAGNKSAKYCIECKDRVMNEKNNIRRTSLYLRKKMSK